MSNSETTQLIAGDTILTIGGRQLSFANLTAMGDESLNRNPMCMWKVELGFDPFSVAMHPPTNVLAVCECDGSSPKIHILQMSDGTPHPLANEKEISTVTTDNPQGDAMQVEKVKLQLEDFKQVRYGFISISQSTVAVVFRGDIESKTEIDSHPDEEEEKATLCLNGFIRRAGTRLFVWNWRTGDFIYSKDRVGYRAMTLVNDTWLVALWSKQEKIERYSGDHEHDYAFRVKDTSKGSNPVISLSLSVPLEFVRGDSGLYSGESALYNPNGSNLKGHSSSGTSDAAIVALIQVPDQFTVNAQIFAVRISQLLALGRGEIEWDPSENHLTGQNKSYEEHNLDYHKRFQDYNKNNITNYVKHYIKPCSVSGTTLMMPLWTRRLVETCELSRNGLLDKDEPEFKESTQITNEYDLNGAQAAIVGDITYIFKTRDGVVELMGKSPGIFHSRRAPLRSRRWPYTLK